MTKQGLERGLILLASSFPDRKFDARSLWLLLQDLKDEQFIDGVYQICRTTTELFPGSNIAAMIRRKAMGAGTTGADAWGEVLRQIGSVGSYGQPSFKEPALTQTVEAFGWRSICTADESDMPTIRAQFLRMYESIQERQYQEQARSTALKPAEIMPWLEQKQAKALQ